MYSTVILVSFNETRIFSTDFFLKNTDISNFMKFRSVGAELFRVDGQTERHNGANSGSSQFFESA